MHIYNFPLYDSFITNDTGLDNKNFGLTEILKIGSIPSQIVTINPTTSESYNNQYFNNLPLQSFYGIINGSIIGYSDNFFGTVSGSNSSFDTSNFTGSINNISYTISGSISASAAEGSITGSIVTYDNNLTLIGSASNLNGCFSGWLTGYSQLNIENETISTILTSYRSLLMFDISKFINDISTYNISNPTFYLKLKTCEARELPIEYSIYALVVSSSWTMGDGYWSDGGSVNGVSWKYRDGTNSWDTSTSSMYTYISLNSSASNGGGGNWYSSSICSQSFNYVASDLMMDVTPIVNLWLSNAIPNNGIILISSAEVSQSNSGFLINYFSENTNTIYSPVLDMAWSDNYYVTGSVITGSSIIQSITASISGISTSSSMFVVPTYINGTFSGSMGVTETIQSDMITYSASGIVDGIGISGNIYGNSIVGGIQGIISIGYFGITGSCGNMFNAQIATASFVDGPWSGSNFTGYYLNNTIVSGSLNGTYNSDILYDSKIICTPIPNSIYYNATIYFPTETDSLIGNISYYSNNSASFTGYFTTGIFNGSLVNLQFQGSIYTSSIDYTSSLTYITQNLTKTDITQPFNINIRDLNSDYKRGDLIKVYINSSEKYPPKTFNRDYQFEEYSHIHYLPSASYYAIKDLFSGEYTIDFDIFTQLSCDYNNGNYFILDTSCLYPDREYQIYLKTSDLFSSYTIDTGKVFKLTK